MDDLISRQAAIDAVEESRRLNPHKDGKFARAHEDEHRHFLKILRYLPSVQPEIIMCKDCKHSEHWYRDKRRCFLWVENGIDVFDDGFCNYAERRQNG